MHHRFELEPHKAGKSTKYLCPVCQESRRTFTRYIDTDTGEYLAEHVGKCDRKYKCGYHLPPREYLSATGISLPHARKVHVPEPVKAASYHEPELLTKYDGRRYGNALIKYLTDIFGHDATSKLIERYRIGTYGRYTIYWQINLAGQLKGGKLIQYDECTGKRKAGATSWLHSKLKLDDFHLKQCLFGEHLLHDRRLPVAIVEGEKTAIIASHLLPDMLWLAAGGISGLNAEKLKVLRGRTVVLYPDLGAFDEWKATAIKFGDLANFTVSDLLEQEATDADRAEGLDIADLLLREWTPPEEQSGATADDQQRPMMHSAGEPSPQPELSWQERLDGFRTYFAAVPVPGQGVELLIDGCLLLNNTGKWISMLFDATEKAQQEAEREHHLLRLYQIGEAIEARCGSTFVKNN